MVTVSFRKARSSLIYTLLIIEDNEIKPDSPKGQKYMSYGCPTISLLTAGYNGTREYLHLKVDYTIIFRNSNSSG